MRHIRSSEESGRMAAQGDCRVPASSARSEIRGKAQPLLVEDFSGLVHGCQPITAHEPQAAAR